MPLPQRKIIRMQWYDYRAEGMYFVTICTQDRQHFFGEVVDGAMSLNDLWSYCDQIIHNISQQRSSVDIHEHIVMPNHVHILLDMQHRPQWKHTEHRRNDIQNGRVSLSGWPHNGNANTPNGNAESVALQKYAWPHHNNERTYAWPTLWSIIGMMKWSVTKYAKNNNIVFQRQSRYHDRIVRDQKEYENIAHYIRTNPEKRSEDRFYEQ